MNDWMARQIVYQIFPDRFAIGRPHTHESKLALPCYEGRKHLGWTDAPQGGDDFFGGDLQGIIDRLDYLRELGVTVVYLTPIFSSPSNHKYDTTDYLAIDPQFGDMGVLQQLIDELHQRHMALILDVSINHVSHRHAWFSAAQAGQEPYRSYFTFNQDRAYLRWRDHHHMPELDLRQRPLQDILFRNSDSVLQRYLDMGVDGWRLDVAPDMGVWMMTAVRHSLSVRFPHRVLIGEVMGFGGEWAGGEDRYHGVMNYYFRDGVLAWLNHQVRGLQLIEALRDCYQSGSALTSWNMLSSHDTPRLLHQLPDDRLRWLGLVAQFTAPGVPMIYYGEETGMSGGPDPDCRRPMGWDRAYWNHTIYQQYRTLINLRQSRPELQIGKFIPLSHTVDTEALFFLRHTDVPGQVSLVAINPTDEPVRRVILLPYSHLYHDLPMRDMLESHAHLRMQAGSVTLEIGPRAAAIWVPDESRYRHYAFFKPVGNLSE